MRSMLPLALMCAALVLCGCGKSENKAELEARTAQEMQQEKAAERRQRDEAEAASRQAASQREAEIRKESAEAFAKFQAERPTMSPSEEANALEVAVARVRARMSDPQAMQARAVRFNAARSAVCMEVNYMERGNYTGFREAYVTPDVIWVEPNAEDVSHRVFEINFKRVGC